jgi:hypothetical protein
MYKRERDCMPKQEGLSYPYTRGSKLFIYKRVIWHPVSRFVNVTKPVSILDVLPCPHPISSLAALKLLQKLILGILHKKPAF